MKAYPVQTAAADLTKELNRVRGEVENAATRLAPRLMVLGWMLQSANDGGLSPPMNHAMETAIDIVAETMSGYASELNALNDSVSQLKERGFCS